MKVTRRGEVTFTETYVVTDGPVVTDQYTGAKFRVLTVVKETTVYDDGEQISDVTVRGTKLRKDGSDREVTSIQVVFGDEVDAVVDQIVREKEAA